MKVHDLKPAAGSKRAPRRVGRGIGGKGGKTAGRGSKGQGARNVPRCLGLVPMLERTSVTRTCVSLAMSMQPR